MHVAIGLALTLFFGASVTGKDMFPRWMALDDFKRDWYSKHLEAMGESALDPSTKGERIRFLWLRSFDRPISVRVECLKACKLTAYELSGAGGYEPGKIDKRQSRELSAKETTDLGLRIERANLWRGQPVEKQFGLDGAQWIVERRRAEDYVAWDVWSPRNEPKHKAFVELCMFLLKLSGFEVRPDRVY